MKYFIDTSFLRRTEGLLFSKSKRINEIVSIGICSDDNREYYAISKDFNLKKAWNEYMYTRFDGTLVSIKSKYKYYWMREGILKTIWEELNQIAFDSAKDSIFNAHSILSDISNDFTYSNLKKLINYYGKSNKQIANEIVKFIALTSCDCDREKKDVTICKKHNIEFYSNNIYSKYKWEALYNLFDKLPIGFPEYYIDIYTILVDKNRDFKTPKGVKIDVRKLPNYPEQANLYNALDNAKWYKELYDFLEKL